VQHLDATGAIAPGWPAGGVLVRRGRRPVRTAPRATGAGGVIVVWRDDRSGNSRLFRGRPRKRDAGGGIPADGRQLSSGDSYDTLSRRGRRGGCFVA
jgi:hypothetical protein